LEKTPKKYEEYAYIIDDPPYGRPGVQRSIYHGRTIIQIVGETYFTLLEAVPRRDATYNIGERIYVGRRGRTIVEHILGRIAYDDLTSAAKEELNKTLETIIRKKSDKFLAFFNNSQPITPRMHAMELIPGIGKRLMWQILEQRERLPFESFEDLQKRVNITDPVKLLTRRVLKELSEDEKYTLFTRPV
jgi:putative nucleotide binding protein